jgi:hypothetical protein
LKGRKEDEGGRRRQERRVRREERRKMDSLIFSLVLAEVYSLGGTLERAREEEGGRRGTFEGKKGGRGRKKEERVIEEG